jgi:hypothetical protein
MVIESADIYGTAFSFTTFNSFKFKTRFGGFLSIMTISLFVIISFLFGSNFFYRENPTVTFDEKYPKESTFIQKFNSTTFPILFNVISIGSYDPINFTNILFPTVLYTNMSLAADGSYEYSEKELPYNICSNVPLHQSIDGMNMSKYYCPVYSQNDMWFLVDNMLAYDAFTIRFSICKNDSDISTCTNLKTLKDFFKNNTPGIVVSFPNYKFSPWSLSDPYKSTMEMKYYQMSLNLRKIDFYSFQLSELQDDQAIIFPGKQILRGYEQSKIDYNMDAAMDNEIFTKPTIYKANFGVKYSYISRTRRFMKLQELLANVGGFMNSIIIVFTIINSLVNPFLRNEKILNDLFEEEKKM